MKRLFLTLTALLSLSGLAYGAGALPTYDGFDYPVSWNLGSQDTFSLSGFKWTGILSHVNSNRYPEMTIASDNLSYPGLASSSGNSVESTSDNSQGLRYHAGMSGTATLLPATPLPRAMYYSLLFKIKDLGALSTGGKLLFSLNNLSTTNQNNTDPATVPGRTVVRLSTTSGKFNVGILSGYSGSVPLSTTTWAPQDFSPNETVFLVYKYVFITTSDSYAYALVNPSPSDLGNAGIDLGTATTPSSTLTNHSTGASSAIAAIQSMLVVPQANTPCTLVLDEVRLGPTFESVAPAGPPGFMTPMPATASVNYGQTLVLNPGAGGPGTLSFQWKKNGANLSDGNGYSGVTTAILSITNAVADQSGSYTLTITSTSYGAAESTACAVSVVDPAITGQPAPQTLPPGANAAFSVVAAGSGTVTYQWRKDEVNLSNGLQGSGSTVSGATTAHLAVNGITPGDIGSYSVVVSGTGPSVVSTNALLTVMDPAITSEPTNQTVDYNADAAFSVTATGTGPLTYQWYKDGADLTDGGKYPGYNTANLTVKNATYLDAGNYQVIVGNNAGNRVSSAAATLTIKDPIVTSQPAPASQVKAAGQSVSFSVVAAGSGILTYQWMSVIGGVTNTLTDGTSISGSITATLILNNLTGARSGSYFVAITGESGQTVASQPVSLVVYDPPVIVAPMQPRTVLPGTRVVLAAGVSGTSPMTYTWTKNGGSPLPVPQTNYLNFAAVTLADAGTYTLVVSNYAGQATSSATLTVQESPALLMLTNLAVLRVGDGSQTPAATGNSVYVDQFTPSGQYVNTVTIPDSGSNAFLMTGGGANLSDCQMTRSGDGTLLCLAGYATNLNYGITLIGSAADVIPRAICTVDGAGNARQALSITNYYGFIVFRAAATDGAGNFWGAAGTSGTRYFGNGDLPAANVQIATPITRVINVFNGDLWFSEAQPGQGLWKFSGLPTSAATPTKVVDLAASGGTPIPAAFSVSPDGLVLYVADERVDGNGGIYRYDYDQDSGSWLFSYFIGTGAPSVGARGLAVDWSGAAPAIYATTGESAQNRIISITDTNGGSSEVITLATSGEKQLYRSLAMSPLLKPTLSVSATATQITLQWLANTSSWTLKSKNALADVGWDTVAATPAVNNGTYTVTLPNSGTKFFRLERP